MNNIALPSCFRCVIYDVYMYCISSPCQYILFSTFAMHCRSSLKIIYVHIFFFQTLNVMFLYNSYKPITNTMWISARLCKLQKRCIRLAPASDKVYQLLVHGRWFSPGTPASSTTKTIRHDIAEILLKVALNTINQSN